MRRYGFLMHPLSMEELHTFEPKSRGKSRALVEKMLEWMPPFEIARRTGIEANGVKVEGVVVCVPLLPEQILGLPADFVLDRLEQAGRIAEQAGVQILGLGAFTAVVGNRGKKLAERLSIPVTTGSSYTACSAVQAVEMAATGMKKKDLAELTAVIVGASGSIGGACAELLAPKVKRIFLVGRKVSAPLEKLAHDLGPKAIASDDIDAAVSAADIIISATNAVGPIIVPEHLKPGVIVCDVARPRDVATRVAHREDVLVIEGGIINVPGHPKVVTDFNLDTGMPDSNAFACEAETMILTLDDIRESYSLGRTIPVEKVRRIAAIAERDGFSIAGLRNFGQDITRSDIRRVRRKARMARTRARLRERSRESWAKVKAQATKARGKGRGKGKGRSKVSA